MYRRAEMALVGVGVVPVGMVLVGQPAHPLVMRPVAVPCSAVDGQTVRLRSKSCIFETTVLQAYNARGGRHRCRVPAAG